MKYSARVVAAAREPCQREALMWDRAVDETEQEVEQLIFVLHPGWAGGRAMAGQIQVDALPSRTVVEQRFNRRSRQAVIARSAVQNKKWPALTEHFIVDGSILKLTFH